MFDTTSKVPRCAGPSLIISVLRRVVFAMCPATIHLTVYRLNLDSVHSLLALAASSGSAWNLS
jgi:hypothetical protein